MTVRWYLSLAPTLYIPFPSLWIIIILFSLKILFLSSLLRAAGILSYFLQFPCILSHYPPSTTPTTTTTTPTTTTPYFLPLPYSLLFYFPIPLFILILYPATTWVCQLRLLLLVPDQFDFPTNFHHHHTYSSVIQKTTLRETEQKRKNHQGRICWNPFNGRHPLLSSS